MKKLTPRKRCPECLKIVEKLNSYGLCKECFKKLKEIKETTLTTLKEDFSQ